MALIRFEKTEPWFLEKAELEERLDALSNPSCGWYQIYSFSLGKPWDAADLEKGLNDRETLSLVLIDIGAYRIRDLDAAALDSLREILEFFRSRGREMILRVTYDTVGKGMEHEPTRFDQVQRHVLQLTGVLRAFTADIFIFQGILVGSWGEMHNSRHLTSERISAVLSLLDSQLDGKVFLAVRKPSFYRLVRSEEEWKKGTERRIGLFNDGLFGSATDLGTYGWQSREDAGWEQPWCISEELAFQQRLCNTVPQGGEAVLPEGALIPLEQTVEQLRMARISYLNAYHDKRILEAWKGQTWDRLDNWHGVNGLDYISAHLGYRFRVLDVSGSRSRWSGNFTVSVLLNNSGFASCYFPLDAALVQIDKNGAVTEYPMQGDTSRLYPGAELWLKCRVEQKKSRLYLKLTRRGDGRAIRLGTASRKGAENGEMLFLGSLRPERTERER